MADSRLKYFNLKNAKITTAEDAINFLIAVEHVLPQAKKILTQQSYRILNMERNLSIEESRYGVDKEVINFVDENQEIAEEATKASKNQSTQGAAAEAIAKIKDAAKEEKKAAKTKKPVEDVQSDK